MIDPVQTLGDRGDKELLFNRKKPSAEPSSEQPHAVTGRGEGGWVGE